MGHYKTITQLKSTRQVAADEMKMYLASALKLNVASSRGKKPTKATIEKRWKLICEDPPSDLQFEPIWKFLTQLYGGFDEEKIDQFIPNVHSIMLTNPNPVFKPFEYYLKIFNI